MNFSCDSGWLCLSLNFSSCTIKKLQIRVQFTHCNFISNAKDGSCRIQLCLYFVCTFSFWRACKSAKAFCLDCKIKYTWNTQIYNIILEKIFIGWKDCGCLGDNDYLRTTSTSFWPCFGPFFFCNLGLNKDVFLLGFVLLSVYFLHWILIKWLGNGTSAHLKFQIERKLEKLIVVWCRR